MGNRRVTLDDIQAQKNKIDTQIAKLREQKKALAEAENKLLAAAEAERIAANLTADQKHALYQTIQAEGIESPES
jgi:poly-gamma-glutamate capsule biosynthesis protein CapA/YwtB (metallophosphatase superfamily)